MHSLFHISEDPGIDVFLPRPSPSYFEAIKGDVVFAIEDRLLHNYLLPRDCPRVCFYAGANTTPADREKFMGDAAFIMMLEQRWKPVIESITIYKYELPASSFTLLDACAGYYISYESVVPIAVSPVNDLLKEIANRKVAVHFIETLGEIADAVKNSTLQFSLVRMRNAQ